ncbi:DUF4822 domain-containing protein [Edaphocola aurantiacus]|uniref:DUF4822 domain-containing protein n=1 Tax=Edaphocola aurantiacus TaxID=2601682 RepID=UPI001C985581|nr:DUF4822 domain-containing protein [Edaphocola aurantiacus]
MNVLKKISMVILLALCSTLIFSCSKDDATPDTVLTPSQLLSRTPWETTNAQNNNGQDVALTDANVSNFVGFAYFKEDGTFTMYNLDDTPKMHGDWSVSADGKTRTIVAKNDAGTVLFTRVVDITVLNKVEFTYRIYPNSNDQTVYFDIIHTPTTHIEP